MMSGVENPFTKVFLHPKIVKTRWYDLKEIRQKEEPTEVNKFKETRYGVIKFVGKYSNQERTVVHFTFQR